MLIGAIGIGTVGVEGQSDLGQFAIVAADVHGPPPRRTSVACDHFSARLIPELADMIAC
jgi:hypothetical protein